MSGVSIAQVVGAVAAAYGLQIEELKGASRRAPILRARHVAYWLASRHCGASDALIGRHIGGRDHSTIGHGIASIERQRGCDPDLVAELAALAATIEHLRTRQMMRAFDEIDAVWLSRRIAGQPQREAVNASVSDIVALARRVLTAQGALERAAHLVGLLADPKACRDETRLAAAGGLLAIELETLGVIQSEKETSHAA